MGPAEGVLRKLGNPSQRLAELELHVLLQLDHAQSRDDILIIMLLIPLTQPCSAAKGPLENVSVAFLAREATTLPSHVHVRDIVTGIRSGSAKVPLDPTRM